MSKINIVGGENPWPLLTVLILVTTFWGPLRVSFRLAAHTFGPCALESHLETLSSSFGDLTTRFQQQIADYHVCFQLFVHFCFSREIVFKIMFL